MRERTSAPKYPERFSQQEQSLPGFESHMHPEPVAEDERYRGSGKLEGKVAVITGGDSGIGKSAAILFAKEGADVVIVYLSEHKDAGATAQRVEELGRKALLLAGDVGNSQFCQEVIDKTIQTFGKLDVLVNNAAQQCLLEGLQDLDDERLERTFRTNIFGYFFMARAALPHLKPGAAIINTTSVEAYKPDPELMDYAATKGAIVNLTRSLATQLSSKGIRVNGVAPGPVWTPLIPATFPADEVKDFGGGSFFNRPAQPAEIGPCFVFLASEIDSGYMTGQVLHPNGGMGMFS